MRAGVLMNPYLRYVCGIPSAAKVPSESTFSRFLDRVVEQEALLDQCLVDIPAPFPRGSTQGGAFQLLAQDALALPRAGSRKFPALS